MYEQEIPALLIVFPIVTTISLLVWFFTYLLLGKGKKKGEIILGQIHNLKVIPSYSVSLEFSINKDVYVIHHYSEDELKITNFKENDSVYLNIYDNALCIYHPDSQNEYNLISINGGHTNFLSFFKIKYPQINNIINNDSTDNIITHK